VIHDAAVLTLPSPTGLSKLKSCCMEFVIWGTHYEWCPPNGRFTQLESERNEEPFDTDKILRRRIRIGNPDPRIKLCLERQFRDHTCQTSSESPTPMHRFNKKLLHIERIRTLYCESPRYSLFIGTHNLAHMKNSSSEFGGSPGPLFQARSRSGWSLLRPCEVVKPSFDPCPFKCSITDVTETLISPLLSPRIGEFQLAGGIFVPNERNRMSGNGGHSGTPFGNPSFRGVKPTGCYVETHAYG